MWTKFGQMAGKAISKIKKPKGIKAKAMSMSPKMKSAVKFGAIAGIPVGAYYLGKDSDKTIKVVDQKLVNKIYNQGVIRGSNNVAQQLDKQMKSMKPGQYIASIQPHDPKRFKKKKKEKN
jgi:hypothetical protein